MSPGHPASPSFKAAAVLLLVAALAGCLQSDPPEDPSGADYIYAADHPEKAPHPASYDGGFRSLEVRGPTLEVDAGGPVQAIRESPGGPVSFPADVDVHDATGTFEPEDGGSESFDGRTVQVRAAGDDGFEVEGVETVTSSRVTFEGGDAEARSLAVEAGNDTFDFSRTATVGEGGAVARDVQVLIGDGGGQHRNGTLRLEAGTYGVTGTPLQVDPAGPVQVPESGGTITLEGAQAEVTLRGEDRPVDGVRLEATRVTGSVDPGAGSAQLDMDLYQWTEDHPRFEADLEAAFESGGTTQEVTLAPGENATYWTRATEVGEVGSAEEVRPRVEDVGDTVDAGFSVYWHDDPNPTAMEQFIRAMIFPAKAFESIFQDPATEEFRPGETAWIPFGVEVGDDAAPGDYTVEGWFHGENAKSQRLQVEVTVTEG